MISVQNIVNKLNQKIANGNLTNEEISQIQGANEFLSKFSIDESASFSQSFSGETSIDVIHNLDTQNVTVQVFDDNNEEITANTISIVNSTAVSIDSPSTSNGRVVVTSSDKNVGFRVQTFDELPDGPSNVGRMIYVTDEEKFYFYSAGVSEWTDDFTSTPFSQNILYAWGDGDFGRLGTGDATDKSSPVTVAGGITNWSSIDAGKRHSLGVTDSGVLYAWGTGFKGRLGTGDSIDRSSPTTVVGGITNWSSVAADEEHSLGLTDTGVLYAWGDNLGGRLGTGDTIRRSSPVTVAGGITNWSSVDTGEEHSLGLTDTGELYAWGDGGIGRLGTGDEIRKSSPVTVLGGITNWSLIAAGKYHSLGLTDTGVLYAWGYANGGRLGTGDTISRSSPTTVVGGITNWSSVAGGGAHSLGFTDTGVLYAWGGNNWQNYGQLGTNDRIDKSSPATVVGGITNWSLIAAYDHSLATTDNGLLYTWGDGGNGQLGTGDATDKSSPVTVAGGITSWVSASAGRNHSLAIVTNEKGFN